MTIVINYCILLISPEACFIMLLFLSAPNCIYQAPLLRSLQAKNKLLVKSSKNGEIMSYPYGDLSWFKMIWPSPLKFTPRGRGHHFVATKRGVLRKTYRIAACKMVGPCASTSSFHHPSILYGGILSPDARFLFFPEYEFCLNAWTLCPKKGTIL